MALSKRQSDILEYIRSFILQHGYPPSIREIGQGVNITSTSVVNYNLNALQREGLIERGKTVSRGIRLLDQDDRRKPDFSSLISVPLLGHIAAGEPIDVAEGAYTSDDTIEVPQGFIDDKDVFALKVKGQSMIDALINDGDYVIMKHVRTAHNGDMVAVWLTDRDETTLKRFYREGDRIRLQPENATMEPIYVDPKVVDVQGKVVAVWRTL